MNIEQNGLLLYRLMPSYLHMYAVKCYINKITDFILVTEYNDGKEMVVDLETIFRFERLLNLRGNILDDTPINVENILLIVDHIFY